MKSSTIEKFNNITTNIDLSGLNQFFLEEGEKREYTKKEYFLRQGEQSQFLGYIEKGTFRYSHIDMEGAIHVVGYGFPNEYVADYASLINGEKAYVDIQAISSCTVHCIPYKKLHQFIEQTTETQRLGRLLAEKLFTNIYKRWLNSFCASPEQRYRQLMQQHPDLEQHITLKEIASFIRVTPETVSHIRKKLALERKS